MTDDLVTWARQLQTLLDATADAMRALGIATNAAGVSDAVHAAAASRSEHAFPNIVKLVRDTIALAERIVAGNRAHGPIVLPLLSVPGEQTVVDLRPWWSRLLDKVSATARRNSAAEGLETLRLEANAALERASTAL